MLEIVLVTGDREWSCIETVYYALSAFSKGTPIIHGDCRGLDRIAHVCSEELNLLPVKCPAHWKHNHKNWVSVYGPCDDDCKEVCGKPAGVIRNRFMLKTYKPTIVLGFHDNIKNSTGTKDMLTIACKAKVPSYLYTSDKNKTEYTLTKNKNNSIISDFFSY